MHSYSSDAGLIKVGGRIFAMITYDQSKVRTYYNGWLHKEWSLTGAPSSTANTVYLGVFLKGVLAEVMFWSRTLVDQEVLELYYFPLFRVVSGASGAMTTPTMLKRWHREKHGLFPYLSVAAKCLLNRHPQPKSQYYEHHKSWNPRSKR